MLIVLTRESGNKVIISTHTVWRIVDMGSYREVCTVDDPRIGISVKESLEEIIELQHNNTVNKTEVKKELKLEVGKTYKARSGKEVKIIKYTQYKTFPYTTFPFMGDDHCDYMENGRYHFDIESEHDLIEEVLD